MKSHIKTELSNNEHLMKTDVRDTRWWENGGQWQDSIRGVWQKQKLQTESSTASTLQKKAFLKRHYIANKTINFVSVPAAGKQIGIQLPTETNTEQTMPDQTCYMMC